MSRSTGRTAGATAARAAAVGAELRTLRQHVRRSSTGSHTGKSGSAHMITTAESCFFFPGEYANVGPTVPQPWQRQLSQRGCG